MTARITSLREFVYNVIVNVAGPRPSDQVLDGLVAYINDIDFLPNPKIAPGGRLARSGKRRRASRRGAVLQAVLRTQAELSCAGCHIPGELFSDQARHDVGSGGLVKTPTLLNANFNAPYFHDGRYDTYEQVVEHFDRVFDLETVDPGRANLWPSRMRSATARRPFDKDGVVLRMKEVLELSSVRSSPRSRPPIPR